MITHKEAEILTSARQDAPLDPVVERELQAHLATCDECRAFAVATERLTSGIKAMPSIPANPRTRREVMEQVQRGRNPLASLLAGFGGGFQTGPVLAAAATIVFIGLFGWLALDRLVFDDGSSDNNQIAAVPTEQPVSVFVASPTQVMPTETPAPTATEVPPEPTETPEPTATDAPPEPTETPAPTATTVPPAPTQVPETATAEEESGPTDLTTMAGQSSTEAARATDVPTATVAPDPTSVPTRVATTAPTEVVTPTVTPEPEPTNTPAIEPMDGSSVQDSDGAGSAESTSVPRGQNSAGDNDSVPIEPVTTSGEQVGSQSNVAIEPIGGGSEDGETSSSGDADVETDQTEPEGQSLEEASTRYTGIDGDPSGHLGLTREGRLEFMQVPDGASRTTAEGFSLESADAQPGVIHLCGDGYCEPGLEAPELETWQGDVPLGVIGDSSYFLRLYSDRTEVYASPSDGTSLYEPQLLTEFGPTSAPGTVYENNGIMFAWLPTGQWLEISGGTAQILSGGFSDPYNLRFAPVANNGPLIGYFSGGTLIIAPVSAPDQAVFSIPTDGVDFDMTGGGTRVAVIRGRDIVIYDIDGNISQVFSGTDVQPGSLIWLNSGIVYVDRNTGALYQIPETAP